MTALEFIHKHQNDEDNGECLILPDGSVEEPLAFAYWQAG